MSQTEANHSRAAIIADLACIIGEMADLQAEQARLSERSAGVQSRLGKMIRDLSTTTAAIRSPMTPDAAQKLQRAIREAPPLPLLAERPAPAAQAATPADIQPQAQSEGEPVRVGKASDEVPVRGAGVDVRTGQSEECRHDAGAGGESAASADTAPAPDERTETMDEPRVPRRPPEVRNAGGGLVQDGGSTGQHRRTHDIVLDRYAETGWRPADLAQDLRLHIPSVSAYIGKARQAQDPRAAEGDRKRGFGAAKSGSSPTPPAAEPDAKPVRSQTEEILDLWASTDLPADDIARQLGLNPGAPSAPSARISAARAVGDKRAAEGDLRRAGRHQQNLPVADGHLIRVEVGTNTGRVFGPGGRWDTTVVCAKALSVLKDGNLYGIKKMDEVAGLKKPHSAADLVPIMQSGLRKIGIELIHTRGIGCKLNRIGAGSA
ncbi:hypothetical protein E4V01_21855 [Methylorubrum sp. Q1]|uniref:hypothetical protein n=1 Tax=Methylorubrum sp. Q1 TaxID=2562453 RepID=UPI001076891A|nr:hypothetical protein [Methylorubrum sp. Q1]TFZ55570.1 hypothetical protein E4V01_21855 [Methylorubrum sp. Q1]